MQFILQQFPEVICSNSGNMAG